MAELALTMPKMSMTMEEGTMVAWLKSIGDPVRSGEPICEVATDKVDMEVESPYDGTLARIVAGEDDVIRVGDPIAYITSESDDLLGGLFDEPVDEPGATVAAEEAAPAAGQTPDDGGSSEWPAAVPAARAAASERGIDLASVTPTGPWGTIRVADVDAHRVAPAEAATSAAAATAAAAAEVSTIEVPAPAASASAASAALPTPAAPPSPALTAASVSTDHAVDSWAGRKKRTRAQVAKVMSASATVPQFTAYAELDLSMLAGIRKTTLGGASWTVILVRAQALALAAHPHLNAYWVDGAVAPNESVGISLAVDSPAGLLAPVLIDPQLGTLGDLARQVAESVDDARKGVVAPSRLSGGTSVFSNLGGFGVESFNALLTPPQSTALAVGAVRDKLTVLEDGAFGVRLGCTVGLTVDHRTADGADAARYLATLKSALADPSALLG